MAAVGVIAHLFGMLHLKARLKPGSYTANTACDVKLILPDIHYLTTQTMMLFIPTTLPLVKLTLGLRYHIQIENRFHTPVFAVSFMRMRYELSDDVTNSRDETSGH